MSVSILECLQNAQHNFKSGMAFQLRVAQSQLDNAIALLEKGYSPHEQVEPLIDKYGTIEAVPEKPE